MSFISKLPDDRLKTIEDWVSQRKPLTKSSYHWWVEDTGSEIKHLIKSISHSKHIVKNIKYEHVDLVERMNEIYVSSKKNDDVTTSDTVFITEHIDGPFCFLKGVSLYRVILAVNESDMYITKITSKPEKNIILTKGDVIGFDFNRTSHLIEKNPKSSSENDRIVLKLHYLGYSKEIWTFYKYFAIICNIMYDRIARQLFLYTLEPNSFLQKKTAHIILIITKMWNKYVAST